MLRQAKATRFPSLLSCFVFTRWADSLLHTSLHWRHQWLRTYSFSIIAYVKVNQPLLTKRQSSEPKVHLAKPNETTDVLLLICSCYCSVIFGPFSVRYLAALKWMSSQGFTGQKAATSSMTFIEKFSLFFFNSDVLSQSQFSLMLATLVSFTFAITILHCCFLPQKNIIPSFP